jgi:pimeloyl-ACP methyl ester carboxylesterase
MSVAPALPTVIMVHGLWFGARSLTLLARRLRKAGFLPRCFRYRSTRAPLAEQSRALRRFIGPAADAPLHFVAHSLGGLVTLSMLADADDLPPGRVVLLGSPVQGSTVARKAAALPGFGLLGAARPALEAGLARPEIRREIGMIAGSRSFGLGLLLGGLGGPGDGTVAITETRFEGLREHRILPVTHTGMLFSREVAQEVASFLRAGSFIPPP